VSFPTKENIVFDDGIKAYTNLILSNTVDETITDFEKLSLTSPKKDEINYTNKDYYSIITPPVVFISETCTCKKSVTDVDNTSDKHTETFRKIEIMSIVDTKINHGKNILLKMVNKKQKNLSFSNEKLWEINRVNQILHKKISNGVKPTYSRLNPSKLCVKATSTINRERKNKDIIKGNEVSFT